MAVALEFAYILFLCIYFYDLLLSFECIESHFASLGMTLASFWLPWDACRSPWCTLGSQGALLGVTLASLSLTCTWDADGPLWGSLSSQALG